MGFFKNVLSSIYSPTFYQSITQKSFGSGLGYFMLLVLLLTLLKTLIFAWPAMAETEQFLSMAVKEVKNFYPAELVIDIKDGQATTNVKEPYFLPLPQSEIANMQPNDIKNLVVIDTKTPYSASQFNQYNAAVWLTKDSLFYKNHADATAEVKSIDLTKLGNFKIDKPIISSLIDQFSPYLVYVGPIIILFIFIGSYLGYSIRLVYLLIFALVIWVLSKLFKKPLSYGQSYIMGMFAITLALLIETVTGLGGYLVGFYGIPFMFTIISLLVVLINYFLPNNSEAENA